MEPMEELSSLMGIQAPNPQEVTVTLYNEDFVPDVTRVFSDIMLVEFQPGFVVFIKEDESFVALSADDISEIVAVTLSEEEDED